MILIHWPMVDLYESFQVIFRLILVADDRVISCEIDLRSMLLDLTGDGIIGLGNGLVPAGNNSLPEPLLT